VPDIEQIAVIAREHIDDVRGSVASGFSPKVRDTVRDMTVPP
jgi:hypothetical protein